MDRSEAASGPQAVNQVAAPVRRFIVIVGKPADDGSVCRVEEPDRVLRVWALLQATSEQMDRAALPPEGIPALQRQLQAIRRELEQAVSPPLAAELRRVVPSQDAAPSAGALRIQCAVLLSWAGSLVVQVLSALADAGERERLSRPPAAA